MGSKSRNFYFKNSRRSTVSYDWEFSLGMHLFRQAERETLKSPRKLGGAKALKGGGGAAKAVNGGSRVKPTNGIVKLAGEVEEGVVLTTLGSPVKYTHSEMLAGGQWLSTVKYRKNPLHHHRVTKFTDYLKEQGRRLPFNNPRQSAHHRRKNRKARRRPALVRKNPVRVGSKVLRQETLFGCKSVSRQGMIFPRVAGYNNYVYRKNYRVIYEAKFRVELQEVIHHRLRLDKWARTQGRNPVALRMLNKSWRDPHNEHRIMEWIRDGFGFPVAQALFGSPMERLPSTPWKRTGAMTGSIDTWDRPLGSGYPDVYGVGEVNPLRLVRYVVPALNSGKMPEGRNPELKGYRVYTDRLVGKNWLRMWPVPLRVTPVKKEILSMVPVQLRDSTRVFKVK